MPMILCENIIAELRVSESEPHNVRADEVSQQENMQLQLTGAQSQFIRNAKKSLFTYRVKRV